MYPSRAQAEMAERGNWLTAPSCSAHHTSHHRFSFERSSLKSPETYNEFPLAHISTVSARLHVSSAPRNAHMQIFHKRRGSRQRRAELKLISILGWETFGSRRFPTPSPHPPSIYARTTNYVLYPQLAGLSEITIFLIITWIPVPER